MKAERTKTDNHNLSGKLELRRYFLRKYHSDSPAHVLDCCQASGTLWLRLRQQFPIATYWGVDKTPKPGRMVIDSARLLSLPGLRQNVIDIDTYGQPWKHLENLFLVLWQPVTVFLTNGRSTAFSQASDLEKRAAGINGMNIPATAGRAIADNLPIGAMLGNMPKHARIVEAMESPHGRNAHYYGIRIDVSSCEQKT